MFSNLCGKLGHAAYKSSLLLKLSDTEEFIPTIVALKNQWRGIVGTLDRPKALEKFIKSISEEPSDFLYEACKEATKEVDGSVFSTCLIGSIASIELLKFPWV